MIHFFCRIRTCTRWRVVMVLLVLMGKRGVCGFCTFVNPLIQSKGPSETLLWPRFISPNREWSPRKTINHLHDHLKIIIRMTILNIWVSCSQRSHSPCAPCYTALIYIEHRPLQTDSYMVRVTWTLKWSVMNTLKNIRIPLWAAD